MNFLTKKINEKDERSKLREFIFYVNKNKESIKLSNESISIIRCCRSMDVKKMINGDHLKIYYSLMSIHSELFRNYGDNEELRSLWWEYIELFSPNN